jgi:hypothetical protein
VTPTPLRPSAFDSELSIQGDGPVTWKLLAPLIWHGTKGDTFTVPVGFVTDFATVPRFLHWLVLPYGPYTRAAVLHDWLLTELAAWSAEHYSNMVRRPIDGSRDHPPANSRDCDGIFRRVMQDLGVPWATRWVMWTAVRWASMFNPRRAYGRNIGRDLPAMLATSALVIPFALPGVVGVLISLGLMKVLKLLAKAAGHK